MNAQEYSKQVAETIIMQLGGNMFCIATGVECFRYETLENGDTAVKFRIGRNINGINHVRVIYNEGQDLYTIELVNVKKGHDTVIASHSGVYGDMLCDIIESNTGIRTRI